jgi:hypothetical protein
MVVYQDKTGKQVAEMVEIKPAKETLLENNKRPSQRTRAVIAINHAKWQAAHHFCKRMGITFRVITENDLFRNGGK